MRAEFRRYFLRKIVVAIVLVFVVITVNFYLVEVLPGDPSRVMLPRDGSGNATGRADLRAQITAQWGLDRPLVDRYLIYMTNILTGEWGTSVAFRRGMDVWDVMAPWEADTFVLIGLGVFFAATLAMLLAPLLARRRGGWGDGLGSMLGLLGFAAPVLFVALTLQYLLGIAYPFFPTFGDASFNSLTLDPMGQMLDHAWHLVLPTLTLTLVLVGPYLLAVRRQWLVEPPEPAHGFAERVFRAVERTVPSVPLLWAWTITSVVFVEVAFGLNGLGQLAYHATLAIDVPLIGATSLLFAMISIGVITVLDVLHALLAPRGTGALAQAALPEGRIGLEDLGATARYAFLRPLGVLGLWLLLSVVVMTLAAPSLVGPYPSNLQAVAPLLPPSSDHPLGTNRMGFDTWTLFLYGGELSLSVAGEVFLVALVLSVALAAASGCLGRWVDRGVALGLDLLLVLPWFPFLGLYAVLAGRHPLDVGAIVLLTLISWAIPARLLRSSVLGDVGSDPVQGAPWTPTAVASRLNSLRGKILGYALLTAAFSVLIISVLGFLGLVASTHESWGEMMNDAWIDLSLYRGAWYEFVPPGLAILVLTYGLALIAFTFRESGHRAATRSRAILLPEPTPDATPTPPPPIP